MRGFLILAGSLALSACGVATATDDADETADAAQEASVATLSSAELSVLLEEGNIRLIDVRTDEEVAEGMIPGAEHIVLDEFDPASLDLSDGREVVLYCRSSRRSGIAAERLSAYTGETARHLEGGILAWEEAGMNIVTAPAD